jgi:hypothetical protein
MQDDADAIVQSVDDALHNLAEGLQSASNYLSAAHHAAKDRGGQSELQDMTKAMNELGRSKAAYRSLRRHLDAARSGKSG